MNVLTGLPRVKPAEMPFRPAMALRIDRPDGSFSDVEIDRTRFAIGSGPRCQLRVRDAGIKPLHCLITCNEGFVTIRRWSPDVRLNGEEFVEAPLEIGDRISLGSVHLEVIARVIEEERPDQCHEEIQPDAVTEPPAGVDDSAASVGSPADVVLSDAVEEVFGQLRSANEINRGRARRLIGALRQQRQATRQLEERLQALEQQLETPGESGQRHSPADKQAHLVADAESGDAGSAWLASSENVPLRAGSSVGVDVDHPLTTISTSPPDVGPVVAEEQESDDHQEPSATFTTDIADRLAQIQEIERELGILADLGADRKPETGDMADLDAAEEPALEPTESAVHNAVESEVESAELSPDKELASETDDLSIPMEETDVSVENDALKDHPDATPASARLEADDDFLPESPAEESTGDLAEEADEPSSSGTDYWGLGANASVDDELLGVAAKNLRKSDPALQADSAEPDVADPSELVDDDQHEINDSDKPASEDSLDLSPVDLPATPEKPPLPGATPPTFPGLSDSALSHLRELSLWDDDTPASNSDAESDTTAEVEAEVTNEPAPAEPPVSEPPLGDSFAESDAERAELAEQLAESPTAEEVVEDHAIDSEPAEDDVPIPFEPAPDDEVLVTAVQPDDFVEQEGEQDLESDVPETEDSPAPSESFIERYAGMFSDEPVEESDSTDLPPTAVGEADFAPATAVDSLLPESDSGDEPVSAADEGDSIDDYMAQLMKRVRGESPAASTSAPASYVPAVVAKPTPKEPPKSPAEDVESQNPISLEEMKEHHTAPAERSADMKALRELANQSARRAIGAHASRKRRDSALGRVMIAFIATASSVYLLLTSPAMLSAQFFGGCITVVIAVCWAVVIVGALIRAEKAAAKSAPPPREEPDPFNPPLPIGEESLDPPSKS